MKFESNSRITAARLDEARAKMDSLEASVRPRMDSLEASVRQRMDSLEASVRARMESLEASVSTAQVGITDISKRISDGQEMREGRKRRRLDSNS